MIAPNSRRLTILLLVCFVFAVHTLRDTVHCYRFQLVFFVGNTGNLSKMAELIEMPFEWQTFVAQGILYQMGSRSVQQFLLRLPICNLHSALL